MSTGRSTLIRISPLLWFACGPGRAAAAAVVVALADNKLRARRGTGQHAFPFRWGVQREKSLLKVTISN
jgi:hypothetical protein